MRLSLSTNWCNRRIEDGRAIADKALELGFGELELGFHTTMRQVEGFRARIDAIPVGSVHAFCPVPLSAPQGYPELYQLASLDEESRKMAVLQVTRNVEFASGIGADTVVLHGGRVSFDRIFDRIDSGDLRKARSDNEGGVGSEAYKKLLARAMQRRVKRGRKTLDLFKTTLSDLVPTLVRCNVTLALENLPYLEGFPAEWEMSELLLEFKDAPVKGWFDTGHDRVRAMYGWRGAVEVKNQAEYARSFFAGMHLNDVEDFEDDHFAPGDGKVDFAALADFARNVRHVVFEPSQLVSEESLKAGIERIRGMWG
jgi:sugar phosphate isomerase/epimerase